MLHSSLETTLFYRTQGATFMLNPNDCGCVLYPEEVDALLRSGTVARVEKILRTNQKVCKRLPTPPRATA